MSNATDYKDGGAAPSESIPSLRFALTLPRDVGLIASTAAAKLNFINHCQYLALFERVAAGRDSCEHAAVIKEKLDALRQIIFKIVDVDSVLGSVD